MPKESISYKLPSYLEKETMVAVTPIKNSIHSWITPSVMTVKNGFIEIFNESSSPVTLKKNSGFADVVKMIESESIEHKAKVNKILQKSNDESHLMMPKILQNPGDFLEEVQIDPDHQ